MSKEDPRERFTLVDVYLRVESQNGDPLDWDSISNKVRFLKSEDKILPNNDYT